MSSILLAVALVLFAVALFSLRVLPPSVGPAEFVLPLLGILASGYLVVHGVSMFGEWTGTALKIEAAAREANGGRGDVVPGQGAAASGMLHAVPLLLVLAGLAGCAGFARRVLTLVRGH